MTSEAQTYRHGKQTVVIRAVVLLLITQCAAFAAHYYGFAQTDLDATVSPLLLHAIAAVMTLIIFLVTVSALRVQLRTSAAQIQQISGETDEILGTVKDGLFLLNPDFSIGRKYSHALAGIFDKDDLAGSDFLDLLGTIVPEKTVTLSREYLSLLFGNRVNENLVTDLNPLDKVEVFLADRDVRFVSKFLEFGFRRVMVNNRVAHLLVHAYDVTDRVALEKDLETAKNKWNEQLDLLFRVLHVDPSVLVDFVTEVSNGLNDINEVLKERSQHSATHRDKLDRIDIKLADIAQQATGLGLHTFEEKAQALQAMLDELRVREQVDGKDFLPFAVKLDEFIGLLDSLRPVLTRINSLRGVLNPTPRVVKEEAKQYPEHPLWGEIYDSTKKLADALGKQVSLRLYGIDQLPDDYHERVAKMLREMMRNSVIHGIETPTERVAAKKSGAGEIRIDIRRVDDSGYEMTYRDDGRGLSEHKIRQAAIARRIGAPEDIAKWDRKRLFSLIFRAGFSTQNDTTAVGAANDDDSRGNGMGIVSANVREVGGKLWLISTDGKSCQFRFWFPELAFNMTDELEIA